MTFIDWLSVIARFVGATALAVVLVVYVGWLGSKAIARAEIRRRARSGG